MTRQEQAYCMLLGKEYRVSVDPIRSRGQWAVRIPSPLGFGWLVTSILSLAQDTIERVGWKEVSG